MDGPDSRLPDCVNARNPKKKKTQLHQLIFNANNRSVLASLLGWFNCISIYSEAMILVDGIPFSTHSSHPQVPPFFLYSLLFTRKWKKSHNFMHPTLHTFLLAIYIYIYIINFYSFFILLSGCILSRACFVRITHSCWLNVQIKLACFRRS